MGEPIPSITALYTGLQYTDSAPATPPTCGTTADASSTAGDYPTTCSGASDPNYTISYVAGTLTINQYAPKLSWSDPADIIYGTKLTTAQLEATADVDGSFASLR